MKLKTNYGWNRLGIKLGRKDNELLVTLPGGAFVYIDPKGGFVSVMSVNDNQESSHGDFRFNQDGSITEE